MRISTAQVFLSNLDNLSRTNNDLFKTQQQLSTGKQVLQPSDDPLAAAQIIKLKKEVALNDQFQGNIDVSRRRLELEGIALEQINNINIRLREISIQAGNGVLSAADRDSLATEVDEMTQQMLGLMNTKDAQGEYLFAGYQGDEPAYAYDEAQKQYLYQGDSGQRFIQIGPDNRIASTDSGQKLFEQIEGLEQAVVSNNPDGVLTGVSISDRALFEEAVGEADLPLSFAVDNTVPPETIVVTNRDGDELFNNTADPSDPTNQLEDVLGLSISLNTSTPAGSYTAEVDLRAEKTNPLNVALKLSDGLRNLDLSDPEQKKEFDSLIAGTLDTLTQAEESNIRARTSLGARINALDQQESVNTDYQLYTKQALSSFEDLDYADAISRFALQKTVLEAAYQSFSQIKDLSLFKYI
ncbi:MAG: flagellar hook-associated protein 3 [Oceanospirillales bacterium]|uniref:Flagellar hook-associated protein 3 FlgL n=1 Tax=Marinobacterium halophilum TaxID=267374 RepID=A0A2P8ES87_9GAMM|nr:flagellar hook-associated protein FlgL [Marinobacterium halophilum]MBR9827676.1 flagellar hook-associated protein 3 [Oceanospirillales bacterium]PSL12341.1 flagellar hook-associated protein 3 FlgL [Marinobacterium halophilum]